MMKFRSCILSSKLVLPLLTFLPILWEGAAAVAAGPDDGTAKNYVLPSLNIHDTLLARALAVNINTRHLQRQQQDIIECTGAPFLWHIVEESTGKHVGFGIGTFHLPVGAVYEDGESSPAWQSKLNALDDSCAVYGELNVLDPGVIATLMECTSAITSNPVYLSDIPDEELREKVIMAYTAVVEYVFPNDIASQQIAVSIAQQMPVDSIVVFIQIYNTRELRDMLLNNDIASSFSFMDQVILEEGRPAGGLEDVATQCELLEEISFTVDENFLVDFEDKWKPLLEQSLTASFSPLIQGYRCGNIDDMIPEILENPFMDVLLDEQNIQMAGRMSEILSSSVQPPLFAVGLLHWTAGENSLKILLQAEGYRLERVTDEHDADDLPDVSDDVCAAALDSSSTTTSTDSPSTTNEELFTSRPSVTSIVGTISPDVNTTIPSTTPLAEKTEAPAVEDPPPAIMMPNISEPSSDAMPASGNATYMTIVLLPTTSVIMLLVQNFLFY